MTDLEEQLTDPDYAGPMQHLRDWSDLDRLHADAATEIARLRDALFALAPYHQGMSSPAGKIIAEALSLPFPLRPSNPR